LGRKAVFFLISLNEFFPRLRILPI